VVVVVEVFVVVMVVLVVVLVVVVDVLVVTVLVVLVVAHGPQRVPGPDETPPAAVHVAASRAMRAPPRQQTTAADLPHVDRAAQRRARSSASPEQPARRSAFPARTTQLTYCPWFLAVSHGHSSAIAAATSTRHERR